MKKVLLISHYPPPAGGIATWTKRVLTKGLPNDWGIVHINSNTINGRDPFENTKRHIKDEYIRSKSVWNQEKEALKNEEGIEVVHTNIPCTVFGMIREFVTGRIAKKYNKKFILHCHCTVPNVVNSTFKRFVFKHFSKLCDGIIVLNQKSYDFVKQLNNKAHTMIIPNFVMSEELNFEKKKVISEKIKKAVFIGGVTPEKGCDTIINAASKIKSIEFNLVGAISDEIKNMDIPDNVVLHGVQNSDYVKKQLDSNDVFIFLSRYFGEGFSCALTEAMAAGLPCIVTDWAANADMIGYTSGGKVIAQQKPEELVKALSELNDSNIRQKMSDLNIERVKSTYIDKVVLKQYADFYDLVVEG